MGVDSYAQDLVWPKLRLSRHQRHTLQPLHLRSNNGSLTAFATLGE